MSNPFVRIAQNDDDVPVRQPLTSSDVLVSRGSVLTGIQTAQSISTLSDTTGSTNLVSSDSLASPGSLLTFILKNVESVPTYASPLAAGGAYANNNLSTFISSISTAGTTYTTNATLYSVITPA